MKKFLIIITFLVFAFSCEDLDVENKNAPTFKEANLPGQVKGTVGGLFNKWYMTAVSVDGPGLVLETVADVASCSWGNFGMKDLSSIPRLEFNNTPSYPNILVSEGYYKGMYSVLSSANDALIAIENDKSGAITDEEKPKLQAAAYFLQGVSLGSLGLFYDKSFIVKEDTDITAEVVTSPYNDVVLSAVESLDKAIALCAANDFTLDDSWLPLEAPMNSKGLGKLANTVAARLLAYKSRNKADNEANDWERIKNYAKKGITQDFTLVMDDVTWYNLAVTYGNYSGWARIDMRVINMLDPNMPAWWSEDLPNNGKATSADKRLDSDFQYLESQNFKPERGLYHFTTYRCKKFDQYLTTWTEPLVYISKAENDMLLAEAYARTGQVADAIAILNNPANTRKARGGLSDVSGGKEEVLKAIFYERTLECLYTGEGVSFLDMRRNDLLYEGTFLHWPIPADQLEVLRQPFYSFGGTTGEPGKDYSTGGWEKKPGYQKPNY